jgi:hypothetical protein
MPRGMPSLSPQVVWTRTRHFARSAPERDGSSRLPAMPASTTCPGLCSVSGHGQSGSERGVKPLQLSLPCTLSTLPLVGDSTKQTWWMHYGGITP